MLRWFLVVPHTTAARLGNLRPKPGSPQLPFTHTVATLFIFCVLHYYGRLLRWAARVPPGELEIWSDPQCRTGSQPLHACAHTVCVNPSPRGQSTRAGVPKPFGGAGPALLPVKQASNKGGEGQGQRLQLENGRKERINFPIALISQGHHKLG